MDTGLFILCWLSSRFSGLQQSELSGHSMQPHHGILNIDFDIISILGNVHAYVVAE